MRLLALLLVAGCAAPAVQATPIWWHGRWVVDGDRLAAPDALRAIPREARRLAADLVRAAAPEYRFEFSDAALRREQPGGEQTHAYTVLRAGPRTVELEGGGATLRLERRPSGIVLREGERPALPLKPAGAR